MKRFISVFLVLLSFIGCNGGDQGNNTVPQAQDLNGTFRTQNVSCSTSSGEPLPVFTRTFKITQAGNSLSAIDQTLGFQYMGSVSGSTVNLTSTYGFQGKSCNDTVSGSAFGPNGGPFVLNTSCDNGASGSCAGQLNRV